MTLHIQDAPDNWPALISQWQNSGLSGQQFCRDHDLIYHRFIYWRTKYAGKAARIVDARPSTPASGFAKVARPPEPVADERLTLSLPGGLALSGITAGNVALLRSVLEQL